MAVAQQQILKSTFTQRIKETGKESGLFGETCSHVNRGGRELVFSTVKHNGEDQPNQIS